MKRDLDNYITGHYGEDQFKGHGDCPECGVELYEDELGIPRCYNEECPKYGLSSGV